MKSLSAANINIKELLNVIFLFIMLECLKKSWYTFIKVFYSNYIAFVEKVLKYWGDNNKIIINRTERTNRSRQANLKNIFSSPNNNFIVGVAINSYTSKEE